MRITRRAFVAGAAILTAGIVLSAGTVLYLPSPANNYKVLSFREVEVVTALADTFFPGDPFPLSGTEAGVVLQVDHIMNELLVGPKKVGMRYLLHFVNWSTIYTDGKRFVELTSKRRKEVLDQLSKPEGFPVIISAIKAFFGMAYFNHPVIKEHIGYYSLCYKD